VSDLACWLGIADSLTFFERLLDAGQVNTLLVTSFSMGVILDVALASMLSYFQCPPPIDPLLVLLFIKLQQAKTGFRRTDAVLSQLAANSVQSGRPPSFPPFQCC